MEFLHRDRGIGSQAHGIKLGVIDPHLGRIGPGTRVWVWYGKRKLLK